METTTGHNLRYPDLSDPPDLASQLHNLADDVEAAFAGIAPDSGVVTNGITVTPATGFTVTKVQHRTIGKKMWLGLTLSRSGAALTTSLITDTNPGNLADTLAATIADAAHRPMIDWYGIFRTSFTSGACQISAANGNVTILDMHDGSSISTGDNLFFYAPYTIP
ncbi:MAG: hypothetical protein J2P24_00315 [Streptosporangiales bacterium]|nr:hypothetical protein [Streptosporangiales bacterium]